MRSQRSKAANRAASAVSRSGPKKSAGGSAWTFAPAAACAATAAAAEGGPAGQSIAANGRSSSLG